ncbi:MULTISPECIES: tRNA pseudouridine(38-40) synthase TruA [Sphingobium]|uniref:tRNA pseudouridine synthase A n=1 Tax=Sphingobium yanoikuyae ATCC 51230 TaxID=883163 RepID=K9CNX8_SPHYA|nr:MULTISPECIES: tRNA pseudouridine(38-40) synthase TruA [Sphingobium]EKU73994.1 tRNA pseudouridine synthase A [Sphingobium yanoikuyae ATCC 51230]WQE07654.1 tRNA pseudouridine(38-40) synthase TruA [Sphingobium yanoikuyae]SHM37205.1 tRNA pseudouridine38-40 synthase [Sphingobium sp. YR657]
MTRFAFTVEFDGRPFMGWQRQAHGPSVQQAIEDAIHAVTGERAILHAAGRTDAGVHGLAMRAHADVEKPLTPFRLMEAINAKLRPHPVAILACEEVAPDWHARFSCTGRAYIYRIANRRAPLTLESGLAWRVIQPLDADAMHDAAQILVGHHDFTTFRSVHCQAASPLKSLAMLNVSREGDRIAIRAEARSFLHHQVRSMVGCLAMVGMGRWSAEDLRDALEARDRARLALNAPPDGLYFVRADYSSAVVTS